MKKFWHWLGIHTWKYRDITTSILPVRECFICGIRQEYSGYLMEWVDENY